MTLSGSAQTMVKTEVTCGVLRGDESIPEAPNGRTILTSIHSQVSVTEWLWGYLFSEWKTMLKELQAN